MIDKDRAEYYAFPEGGIAMSACAYCKHKQRGITCEAFPDGIPDEILMMKNDHLAPVEGDHGIQFEARYPETAPERLKAKGTF